MGLSEVLTLSITSTSAMPTRAGFGTPLLMAYHTLPIALRSYTNLQGMISDGFVVTSPAYLMAQAVFSQNPRPTQVMIGQRAHAFTQILSIVPANTTVGFVYAFKVTDHLGVVTPVSYTVLNGDTVALIITALVAALAGVSGVTSVGVGGTHFTMTAGTPGQIFALSNLPLPAYLQIQDTTADPGIATDMTAIEAIDEGASWYAVTLDHAGKAEIIALAAWVESRRKLALNNTSDYDVLTGSTSDVASTIKASAYVRSDILCSYVATQQYSAAAWLGKMLAQDAGSATWAYKTLAGVAPDGLSSSQKTSANTTKNANTYTTLADINITQWGKDANGGYTDIVMGTDLIFARLQEDVFTLFANTKKVPYTNSGIDMIRAVVLNRLLAVSKDPFNILAPSPASAAPQVFFPRKEDIDPAEVLARNLPNGTFTATYQGAIHTVVLNGTISF